jgi:hypothetical protein
MKLTKERKIYVGLFVLAAGAFLGDQLFSGPNAASADVEPAAVATARPASSPASASVSPRAAMTVQLAERLRTLDHDQALSATALSDPFKLSKSWDGLSDAPADGQAWSFSRRHRLTAVMVSGARGGSAIIDGQLVAVGQSLEGFKLVEVSTRSATFEHDKQIARLTLTDN